MPIPPYDDLMLPILEALVDRAEHRFADLCDSIAQKMELTEEEKAELLPSGRHTKLKSRVGWAKTYLHKAGLLTLPRRGWVQLTARGGDALRDCGGTLGLAYLRRFPEFIEFERPAPQSVGNESQPASEAIEVESEPARELPPQLAIEEAYGRLNAQLKTKVLDALLASSPEFFERVVLDLLVAMGYGGSRQDAARHLGRSGDRGLDGVINQDRLGLDVVYVQAKRYTEGNVGGHEVDRFSAAIRRKKATKGVLITTSGFTKEALVAQKELDTRLVLIDGDRLAELMVEHGIGVSVEFTYVVRRLDSDYFADE